MKHWPGPWCIDDTLNDLNEDYEGQEIIISKDGCPLATIRGTDDMICIDEEDIEKINEEVQANAKLIAAAPDLLEVAIKLIAIRELIEYPDKVSPEHEGEAMAISQLMQLTEMAIKKATE